MRVLGPTAFRSTVRAFAAVAALTFLLGACGGDPEPSEPAAPAQSATAGISIARCLDALGSNSLPDAVACPAFLVGLVRDAEQACREAGGKLVAAEPADLWTLDVNGDGRQELAFDYDAIVVCEGAWSLFSCGSLGCPKKLYQERADGWAAIGDLFAATADAIDVTATPAADGYRELRVGCGSAADDCAAVWNYTWRDGSYQPTTGDVRGHRVDLGSVHGLYPLVAETAVLAEPAADAAVLQRYEAATDVAIIGTAENGYYYVSPCNACESGFVPKTALFTPE